jgi:putative tryptophan/tyrosine transport system substrate-binding protein
LITEGLKVCLAELRRQGYVQGQNLIVEQYSGNGITDRYGELAEEVVRSKPDVIFTLSARLGEHFKAATATIPIVLISFDPVAYGLVPSLRHPGGNIGIQMAGKLLEVLKEAVPQTSKFGFLAPQKTWEGPYGSKIQEISRRIGIPIYGATLNSPVDEPEYRRAFAALTEEGVNALVVSDSPEHYTYLPLIVILAEKNRLPTLYPWRRFAERGGLIMYGYDSFDLFVHIADSIDQIFKGANPGNIPFHLGTKFQLVVNLKTAKALGLTIPPSILARADEVIE